LTDATREIQIDRYSRINNKGASIAFIDTLNTFKGWKLKLDTQDAWSQYNAVDFGRKKLKSVRGKVLSPTGGTLLIRLDKADGTIMAEVKVPKGSSWNTVDARVIKYQKGIHNLFVILKDNNPVEIDWIQFIK